MMALSVVLLLVTVEVFVELNPQTMFPKVRVVGDVVILV